jgi:Uma2 family endonuclease
MSVALATEKTTTYTPEDLLAMPDGKNYELVDGRLVERNMGAESSWIGGNLYFALRSHCNEPGAGWVWPADNGYQCFPHAPKLVRRPDVSFIRAGRFPGGELPKGHVRIPPDLAVEVVSPNDLAYEVEERVDDYLKAGVPLIWVIHPENRTVFIRRGNGTVSRLDQNDELSGEEVIPGFRCAVRSLFPSKEREEGPKTEMTDAPLESRQ